MTPGDILLQAQNNQKASTQIQLCCRTYIMFYSLIYILGPVGNSLGFWINGNLTSYHSFMGGPGLKSLCLPLYPICILLLS